MSYTDEQATNKSPPDPPSRVPSVGLLRLRILTPIMESQLAKKMEHEMEAGVCYGFNKVLRGLSTNTVLITENQMQENMDNEIETGCISVFIRITNFISPTPEIRTPVLSYHSYEVILSMHQTLNEAVLTKVGNRLKCSTSGLGSYCNILGSNTSYDSGIRVQGVPYPQMVICPLYEPYMEAPTWTWGLGFRVIMGSLSHPMLPSVASRTVKLCLGLLGGEPMNIVVSKHL